MGVALRAGHPVYFVTFFPEPEPGQRLRDVAAAEAMFIEEVARRHPEAQGKPCVVGNCQAGWAVAALAAVRPEIMGPVILNGAPLSYWSGAANQNPMRYAGGLLGGKWLESLTCDLGNGLFDGAHLVSNFENLDPANTLLEEVLQPLLQDRHRAAALPGVRNLVGRLLPDEPRGDRRHRLGVVHRQQAGSRADRARRRASRSTCATSARPIVVFASWGDNITPPQQALNWIEDVYGDEQEIIANDQIIVYLLHEDIGHLGIFVSGRVAAKEHKELIGTLEMIDALPAGLYEMIIERKDAAAKHGELEPGEYLVRFEARKMDDIRSLDDTREEEDLLPDGRCRLADQRPVLQDVCESVGASDDHAADRPRFLRRLHPLRVQHEWFSGRNPLIRRLPALAEAVRENRRPVAEDNPFLSMEKMASTAITTALDTFREVRDTLSERFFRFAYGPAGFGAFFPPKPGTPLAHRPRGSAGSGAGGVV